MKRLLLLVLTAVLLLGAPAVLSSCAAPLSDAEISVVAMNFAAYDFAAEVAGRNNARVSVELLAGGDSHSFNPTFRDVASIQNCDLFLYVGGESDSAVDTILASCPGVNTLRMIDCVPLLEEEHDHDHAHEEEGKSETEYDEHVWTSPENAILIVNRIEEALSELDPAFRETYRKNAAAYCEALEALDRDFRALFASCRQPLVFGDRFPFLYFAKSYGLICYAAFPGCSSASEPTPKVVLSLIDTIEREGVTTVFYIESGTHSVAFRLAEETGTEAALLHSCHKVSPEEIEAGATYLSLMRQNYETLVRAVSPAAEQ